MSLIVGRGLSSSEKTTMVADPGWKSLVETGYSDDGQGVCILLGLYMCVGISQGVTMCVVVYVCSAAGCR